MAMCPPISRSVCMDWAAERYAYRSRIGQQSKSLGGQETMAFHRQGRSRLRGERIAALSPRGDAMIEIDLRCGRRARRAPASEPMRFALRWKRGSSKNCLAKTCRRAPARLQPRSNPRSRMMDRLLSISASSIGVPYAAIQEFGGKTAAHDIVAVKGKGIGL